MINGDQIIGIMSADLAIDWLIYCQCPHYYWFTIIIINALLVYWFLIIIPCTVLIVFSDQKRQWEEAAE